MHKSTIKYHARVAAMLPYKLSGLSYSEIGNIFGVSSQRVQQILSPNRQTKTEIYIKYNHKCVKCGSNERLIIHHITNNPSYYNEITNLILLCDSCHMKLHHPKWLNTCLFCGTQFRGEHEIHVKYCSDGCYYMASHTIVKCAVCNKLFSLYNSRFMRQKRQHATNGTNNFYCSKKCYGTYWGNNYGSKSLERMRKIETIITCQNCGGNFKTTAPNPKYCSTECRRIKRNEISRIKYKELNHF